MTLPVAPGHATPEAAVAGYFAGGDRCFLYLAVVSGFDITIGGVSVTKKGLSPAQQVKMAMALLPGLFRSAAGLSKREET